MHFKQPDLHCCELLQRIISVFSQNLQHRHCSCHPACMLIFETSDIDYSFFKITMMKKLLVAVMLCSASLFATSSAKAQIIDFPQVLAAAGNLVNLQIGDVNVNVVDVVDVSDVLNGNDVTAIVQILKDVKIDNVLNNLLREADIITGNQVVVGVVVNLLGEATQVLVADKKSLK
jgi:hypothetical protein